MDGGTLTPLSQLEARAGEAAAFLRLLANEKRLLVLCHLLMQGEQDVTSLAATVGLSQSALSQHLARLRDDGLVTFRREGQFLHYRLDDARVPVLLGVLKDTFCPDL